MRVKNLLAIVPVFFLLTSEKCEPSQNGKINIAGEWVVDSMQFLQSELDIIPEDILNDDNRGAVYHFKSDSTFTISTDSATYGNYSIVTENAKPYLIFINPEMDIDTKMEITHITNKQLWLKSESGYFTLIVYYSRK